MHAGKNVENRTTNIAGNYRGPLAIHTSKGKPTDAGYAVDAAEWMSSRGLLAQSGIAGNHPLYQGCVIGVVDLVDVHHADGDGDEPCSPWATSGVWHMVVENPRPLPIPSMYAGALGLWELPDHLLRGIR